MEEQRCGPCKFWIWLISREVQPELRIVPIMEQALPQLEGTTIHQPQDRRIEVLPRDTMDTHPFPLSLRMQADRLPKRVLLLDLQSALLTRITSQLHTLLTAAPRRKPIRPRRTRQLLVRHLESRVLLRIRRLPRAIVF